MITSKYLKNITPANNQTIHNYSNQTLSTSSLNLVHSDAEFNNLIYNSNLENNNMIK